MDSRLVTDFIKAQRALPSAPPKKATRTSKVVMNPGNRMEVEQGFEYIITKKPKAKKVMKYLQGMVDEIMADAD